MPSIAVFALPASDQPDILYQFDSEYNGAGWGRGPRLRLLPHTSAELTRRASCGDDPTHGSRADDIPVRYAAIPCCRICSMTIWASFSE